ncbi:MAG: thioredoxin family protein [Deltaproteobacteria bacterium]|nr:thioredoxin family protein [Deltaproteobacteria bacterium]
MKQVALAVPAAFLVLALLSGCKEPPQAVNWVHDYRFGLEMARESGKPVFLVFGTDWCGICRDMKAKVYSLESVGRATERTINIYVDANARPDLVRQYGIRGVPALFFLTPDGETISRYGGPLTPNAIIKAISMVAQKYGQAPALN